MKGIGEFLLCLSVLFGSQISRRCKVSICIFFIKLRWPKNKSLCVHILLLLFFSLAVIYFFGLMLFDLLSLLVCLFFFLHVFLFFYIYSWTFPPPLSPFITLKAVISVLISISTRQERQGYRCSMFPHVR